MASTKELRRRIKSIKSTSQITRAMQMVSATKMRKAQNQAMLSRPYTQTLLAILAQAQGKVQMDSYPLLLPSGGTKTGVLLLSTDKGLCGALNTNLLRIMNSELRIKNENTVFYTIGKKGRDFVVRTGKELAADFENQEKVEFRQATTLRKMVVEAYLKNEVKEVYVLYPHFISTLRQEPKMVKILPIDPDAFMSVIPAKAGIQNNADMTGSPVKPGMTNSYKDGFGSSEILFEPNMNQVLDFALTHFVEIQIYQALLETKASEHSARMIAMQNATDNAKELVNDLTLSYNQLRQSAITTELLEITSAGAALE